MTSGMTIPPSILSLFFALRPVIDSENFINSSFSLIFMSYQEELWNQYKSQGETKIGSYLTERGIVFTYEKPVAVVDGGKTKIWHPDFYLDKYHILMEYLGMNGNRESAKINSYKRKVYRENRLDLIEVNVMDFKKNWRKKIDMEIQGKLESRLEDYVSKPSRPTSGTNEIQKPASQLSFNFYS